MFYINVYLYFFNFYLISFIAVIVSIDFITDKDTNSIITMFTYYSGGCKQFDFSSFDILYDHVASKAREIFPENVANEVKAKLANFLQTQFEDHI